MPSEWSPHLDAHSRIPPSRRRIRLPDILAVGGACVFVCHSAIAQQPPGSLRPHVLRAGATEIGIVYPPELLAQLIARRAPTLVDQRVAEAVRARTPIVVMWSTPLSDGMSASPSPWRITIVEANGDPVNTDRIEPLWIQSDARLLGQLDDRLARRDVAAIAAFPREAFVLGRVVFLYLRYPPDYEQHVVRSIRRSARIDWDGTRPDSQAARDPRF